MLFYPAGIDGVHSCDQPHDKQSLIFYFSSLPDSPGYIQSPLNQYWLHMQIPHEESFHSSTHKPDL